MIWEPNKIYEINGTGEIKFFNVDVDILCELYADGRRSGLLVEDVLEKTFKNIYKVGSEKSKYDVINSITNTKIECRALTPNGEKNGLQLIPSKQIGSGRTYNKAEYIDKLNLISHFIFVDVRSLPIMKIFSMPSSAALINPDKPIRSLSIKTINELISKCGTPEIINI